MDDITSEEAKPTELLLNEEGLNPVAVPQTAESAPGLDDPTTSVTEDAPEFAAIFEENASYERVNFTLNTELSAVKDQLVQLSAQKEQLQQQITCIGNELQERSRLFRQMEASRNELSFKCTTLEAESMRVKNDKEERDNIIKNLTKEKHTIITENLQLKDEVKNIATEKSNLALQLHNLEQEKRNIAFERERAQTDKALYEESKKWFMKEIADKDSAMTKLRMEISAMEIKWQNERMDYGKQLKELKIQSNKLQEMLDLKEDSLSKSISSIESREADHRKEIQNLEREMRASKELTELYKDSMDKAEQCASEFREALKTKESLAQSTKVLIEELRHEMEVDKQNYMSDLLEKDERIRELEDEIQKANEMLKNKHAVSLNLTEDELANLSPAAAETSRFVKGGMTLTGMMREQARLAGELAAERERSSQLESAMKEIVEDIETNAPHLLHQKQQMDKLFDENSRLKEQLESADQNRYKLESSRDAAIRELAFTRAELEKFQRDLMDLTKKHQHLLFVLEKERMVRDTNSPPPSDDDDRLLYDSIVQLQKRNMQLESELASEKASAGQALMAAQNTEMDKLKIELETHISTNERLSVQLEQMQTAFDTLQEQSKRLSALVEDNVSAAEARCARQKAEDAIAELRSAEMKIARLEETVNYLKEEKAINNKTSEEKIAAYQSTINELSQTRAKLEAEFEQQKQIALTSSKELELIEKEISQTKKDYEQAVAAEQAANQKLSDFTAKHIEMHDQYTTYKIKYTVLEEEQKQANLLIGRLQGQIELFKSTSFADQQMMSSLTELSTRLSRMEAEKQVRLGNQVEVMQMESETLKTTAARATAQLTQARNDAKVQQYKLEQHITLLGTQLSEKEEQLRVSDLQLNELKARLASIQSQYSGEDNTDDMSPERLKKECQQLKNRAQYLENQCEELKNKLSAAEVEVARKEDEMTKLFTHSGKMETGLVEAQRVGVLERARLEDRAQAAETRADGLSVTISELRTALDTKENEIVDLRINHLKNINDLQQRVDVQAQIMSTSEDEIKVCKTTIENMKIEMEKKEAEFNAMVDEVATATEQYGDVQAKLSLLEARIQAEQEKVFQAQESTRIAEECRASAENSLAQLTKKVEEDEVKWQEIIQQNSARVAELIKQYEELIVKFGSEESVAHDPELPQSVICSQQGVIQFLRDEKEATSNRAMKSEIEVLRLRAEARELSSGRDELVNKVKRLEIEAGVAGEALAEKAQLLKKVEELLSFQQQCVRIQGEKERLVQVCTESQKKVKDYEAEIEKLKQEVASSLQHATQQEAQTVKLQKELEILNERLGSMRQEKTNQLAAQVEQLTAKVQLLTKENLTLAAQEKNYEGYKSKFEQARSLAIKYRDQLAAEKQKPGATGSGEEFEKLQSEKKELETKLEEHVKQVTDLNSEKQKFLTELDMKSNEIKECHIRLQLLTAQLGKIKAELADSHKTIKGLEEKKGSVPSTENDQSSLVLASTASLPGTSASTARVAAASLFSTTSSFSSYPSSVGTSSVASTYTRPTGSVFESSNISSNTVSATSVAGQSNQVSGSINVGDESIDEVLNGGESRDSAMNAPVSSTDAGRKRPAAEFGADSEVKRQRESPNETVTSSEQAAVLQHENAAAPPQEDENSSSQDAIVFPPEEDHSDDGIHHDLAGNEGLSDEENEGLGEDYDDIAGLDQDVEEISDDGDVIQVDDDDEEGVEGEEGEDEDDLGADAGEDEDDDILEVPIDEHSRSAASLDQDREAASAMEEADDEERESVDSGAIHGEVSASHPIASNVDLRPQRAPIVFNVESDDQCSSSNETNTVSQQASVLRGGRGGRPRRGVPLYQRGRGKRGNK